VSTRPRHGWFTPDGEGHGALTALVKLQQSLPRKIADRLRFFEAAVDESGQRPEATAWGRVEPEVLVELASACQAHHRIRLSYRDRRGTTGERDVEPQRLVRTAHRWYLVAWDLDRADWRTFRVDRANRHVVWLAATGTRLFRLRSAGRVSALALPANSGEEFESRCSALADVLRNLSLDGDQAKGPLNLLKRHLQDKLPADGAGRAAAAAAPHARGTPKRRRPQGLPGQPARRPIRVRVQRRQSHRDRLLVGVRRR
jgi:hypothetical protein